jgi:diacylglycerol kinase (ATP)
VTRTVALLVNPTAGGGRGAREGRAAADQLRAKGLGVRLLEGADATDALRVTQDALRSGVDALVVAGGDGMVHLGVQCVAGTDVPLGVVPTGTGNDFAAALGIPSHDAAAAADVIARWTPRDVDAVLTDSEVGKRWYAGVLSSGFDSAVNERGNRMRWPKGRAKYNVAMVAELGVFKALPFRITVDGTLHEANAMLAAVGNNTSYGGGMKITPGAVLDDGLLHVTVVRELGRVEFLRIFPRVYKGTHVSHWSVDVYSGREVQVEAPGAVAYADGERIGPLPVTATCVPGALRVLAWDPA